MHALSVRVEGLKNAFDGRYSASMRVVPRIISHIIRPGMQETVFRGFFIPVGKDPGRCSLSDIPYQTDNCQPGLAWMKEDNKM